MITIKISNPEIEKKFTKKRNIKNTKGLFGRIGGINSLSFLAGPGTYEIVEPFKYLIKKS